MKHLFYSLFLFCVILSYGQEVSPSWLSNTPARNIGPGGMSGRVTTIDVVNNAPDNIYVGTASGGVWKSSSGGIDWTPIFNDQITASIGALKIQQSNPDVIWVGTGEGNPRNSLNGGYGIFKSLDGGKTWQSMGLENTRHIHRIIIDPTQPNTVYVAAIGSPWGVHPERGIYKTTDGGKSWKKILYQNPKTGAADLVMEDGLPKGDLGRIGLAIAKNKPNIVYALVEAKKNALYKSIDGGEKWVKVNDKNDIGNRPFYYSDIRVDPENENRTKFQAIDASLWGE